MPAVFLPLRRTATEEPRNVIPMLRPTGGFDILWGCGSAFAEERLRLSAVWPVLNDRLREGDVAIASMEKRS